MNQTEKEIESILIDMDKKFEENDLPEIDIFNDTIDLIKQEIGFND